MPRLSTIIGQDPAVHRLQVAMNHGLIGHSYLFAGPSGAGKTTTARAFAKAINCDQAGSLIGGVADSCDVCASCRQADAGVHPDIHLVRQALSEAEGPDRKASTEILIAQVRELLRMLNLSPSVGRRKVFIISPADAMNAQAQNALLKSLEEPPPLSTLILCAESSESVLETIRSRCQVLRFGLVPPELIELRLRELYGLPPERAAALAAISQGRIGRALRMAEDPERWDARARLIDGVEAALREGPLHALQSASALRDAAMQVPVPVENLSGSGSENASDRVAGRIQIQLLFEEMALFVRDLLVLQMDQPDESEKLLVNQDRAASLRDLARSRPLPALQRSLDAILTAQDLLRRNVNPQLLLEDILLDLSWTNRHV